MKVQATRLGFYDNQRKKEGEVFDIKDKQAFSENWMKSLDSAKDAKEASEVSELHKKQAVETFNAQPRPGKSSPSRFFSASAPKVEVKKDVVKDEAKAKEVKPSDVKAEKADKK